MTITDLVQAISMVVLVGVTTYYAWQTKRTVQELRLQRIAAKPILVPDIDLHTESYDRVMKKIAQSEFPVVVTNVGTQAAIEIEVTIKGPHGNIGNTYNLPLLLAGAKWESNFIYVEEDTESDEPNFGQPPSDGLYELRVAFRPAVSENELLSEVSLPFELHWFGTNKIVRAGETYYYDIKRSRLNIKL